MSPLSGVAVYGADIAVHTELPPSVSAAVQRSARVVRGGQGGHVDITYLSWAASWEQALWERIAHVCEQLDGQPLAALEAAGWDIASNLVDVLADRCQPHPQPALRLLMWGGSLLGGEEMGVGVHDVAAGLEVVMGRCRSNQFEQLDSHVLGYVRDGAVVDEPWPAHW